MDLLKTTDFENKIKMWIPYSEARPGLNMSPYTGKPFDCGCGKTHLYNNIHTPPFMDGGMFKMALMIRECKYFTAVKVRGVFDTEKMQSLFACKFEEKKKDMVLSSSIQKLIKKLIFGLPIDGVYKILFY